MPNRSLVCLPLFVPWLALLGWFSSVAWFLCDDAFISFRYVRNLLEGHGLVFNPGEYVEGYTNFLWILELAAIWGIFGIRPEHAAPWLSVAYTVGTIAAMLWWVVRLPSLSNRWLIGWMALGLLCSSATFAVWTSGGGLETRQFTFFVVTAVVFLSVNRSWRWGLLAASLSLAAAELTRPEGLLLAACCFGWFGVQRIVKEGRVSARLVRELMILVAPFVLLVSAHFLFRYAYYGEWLPNTYYAKHVRPWYESGFRYLWAAALETGLYLLLPLAYLALRTRWRANRDGTYALVLLCVVTHMAYLLPIGGDHFEYRPLDFYWPLLAVPAAEGIALLGSRVVGGLGRFIHGPNLVVSGKTFAIVFFLPVLFYANAIQGILLFKGLEMRQHSNSEYAELNRENVGWLLAAPVMPAVVAISNNLRRLSGNHSVARRSPVHRIWFNSTTNNWKPYEEMERGIIPEDALAIGFGLGKYFYLPELKVIDQFGLTDATVARAPVKRSNLNRVMAHDRRPSPEYSRERGVNIKVHAPRRSATGALARADFAVKVGPDLWMPFDTVDPQWAATRFGSHEFRAKKEFSTVEAASNQIHAGNYTYVGESILGHFENGFEGWRLTGEAFTNYNQHENYEGLPLIWGRTGSGFLTSYHPDLGNFATGKAFSPKFSAKDDQFLAFLIAGGNVEGVGLRLLVDEEEVAVWRGGSSQQFELVVHPLAFVAGKSLQLELFDNELGDRGHIMLDYVMLVACKRCSEDPRIILANALKARKTEADASYILPGFQVNFDLDYLYRGIARVYTLPMNAPNLAQRVEDALLDLGSTVGVVEWNTFNRWIDDDSIPLHFLLTKYGRHLRSEQYDEFQIHNYLVASPLKHTWTFYEWLEPLTVNYDGGIALQGLALGQGAEQLSFRQQLNLRRERSLWGVMQWQTEPGLEVDYAISLRLYDETGDRVYQADDVLWNPLKHSPTTRWHAHEPVDTLHLLDIPTELPPGDYELRMVVYNFETQRPTVQEGVWEPETTLARLRLAGVE